MKFLIILLVFPFLIFAKVPNLESSDVKYQIAKILKEHAKYKKIDKELASRALKNFIEELDGAKTYLLMPEIKTFLEPDEQMLHALVKEYSNSNFTTFRKIFKIMQSAIERRRALNLEIVEQDYPQELDEKQLKDNDWEADLQGLKDKLLLIKGLQQKNIEFLDEEFQQNFEARLAKYRLAAEKKVIGEEKEGYFYSLVLKATASSLDSQTYYFTPQEATQLMIQVQSRLFGIGAQLRDDLTGLTITRLLDGGPAMRGELLKIGDSIIAVDGEVIMGMSITDAVELIRGEKGKKVTLTVLRKKGDSEKKLDIDIVRDEVILEEGRLESKMLPFGDGVIGYFRLHSFYQDAKSSSASDIEEGIEKMRKKYEIKGMILDLRNNAGGLLPQAIDVAGLFIQKGIVASVKDPAGRVQHLRNLIIEPAFTGPLIILMNPLSASASEIVAGALQDYGRAIIVGETSFGKGTLQSFTLDGLSPGRVNPKGEYKVTRGVYYTVSGKSPQLIGIEKDIVVPGPYHCMEIGEKYSKFPLANESIESNFEDNFKDVPFLQRDKVRRLYQLGYQKKVDLYGSYLSQLISNSEKRLKQNKKYQKNLKKLKKEDHYLNEEIEDHMNQVQFEESVNVIKDLILLEASSKEAIAA